MLRHKIFNYSINIVDKTRKTPERYQVDFDCEISKCGESEEWGSLIRIYKNHSQRVSETFADTSRKRCHVNFLFDHLPVKFYSAWRLIDTKKGSRKLLGRREADVILIFNYLHTTFLISGLKAFLLRPFFPDCIIFSAPAPSRFPFNKSTSMCAKAEAASPVEFPLSGKRVNAMKFYWIK